MKVLQGSSTHADADAAVAEALSSIGVSPRAAAPDVVFVFASTKQDPARVGSLLKERFPTSIIVGCTTAGEIVDAGHTTGGLAVSAVWSPEVKWTLGVVRDVSAFHEAGARALADDLFRGLGTTRDEVDARKHFCVTFIDGLSMKEEHVVSLMAEALEGLPVLGGSSGDDLAFKTTRIFVNGEALTGAAAFLMGESKRPFTIIKHQHYTTTPEQIVITKADVAARRVYEMDGYPALEAYARALGLPPEKVDGDVCFMHPLTFVSGGEIYVRSIQRVEPDGSIIFYCGIEEGMVLSVGGHEDMEAALARDLEAQTKAHGKPDLFLACNCILRALESTKLGAHAALGKVLTRNAGHVIGFDTYGEQLNGLHINQTLVGLGLYGESGVPS